MAERFVTLPELRTVYGIPYSRMHLDRLIKAGRFPQKHRVSHRLVVWLASEIEAWQAAAVSRTLAESPEAANKTGAKPLMVH